MIPNRRTILLPVTLITFGSGWLQSAPVIVPQIDWFRALGLVALGILFLADGGVDTFTVVIGPFVMITSLLSVLRDTGHLAMTVDVAMPVIVLGILVLLTADLQTVVDRVCARG